MMNNKNFNWSIRGIAYQYHKENPEWSLNKCLEKAEIIYRELNRLNRRDWNSSKSFFSNNIPFSAFDNKDSEFGDVFYDNSNY